MRGPRRREGTGMYLLEVKTQKGTVTREKILTVQDATENQLTLTMIEEAMGRITRPVRLTIWTDCEYVAGAIKQQWPQRWEKDAWLNSKGRPVTDKEKWQSVLGRIRLHEVFVVVNERHEYYAWMKREIAKVAPVQREGE